jgi:prophage regulatory protein
MAADLEIQHIDALLSLQQVCQLVPLSGSHIYRLIRSRNFPSPIKLGPSRVAWRSSAISAYIADPMGWSADDAF